MSLHKEIRTSDQALLNNQVSIRTYCHELNDFSDTAALCELMDIVISVDTSVAHLASALGKETWVLLPYAPDWRWLLDRQDSPWYQSVCLYRQDEHRDWHNVMISIAADLTNRLASFSFASTSSTN
jgi:ADP-heptose:LPS heptosyltransferase